MTTDDRDPIRRMEGMLAALLKWGAALAAAWIAAGMAIGLVGGAWPGAPDGPARACATVGVALLIALPAIRVALTVVIFLFERDYVFAAVSGVVLTIIVVGFLLGAALD